MHPTDSSEKATPSTRPPVDAHDAAAPGMGEVPGDHPFGPYAAQILATEHWSLLAARSLIWTEGLHRITVFLTVLSAAIIALALLADATGFGPQTTTLALVLLPIVLLLGVATYVRQVRINTEEFQLVQAMNRLRHAYLKLEPGLTPYFTTGHHDDEQGVMATYMVGVDAIRRSHGVHFLTSTPTIVATVVAALAAAIAVLVLQVAEASTAAAVGSGAAAFLLVWAGLMALQRHALDPLRNTAPRFPTPSDMP